MYPTNALMNAVISTVHVYMPMLGMVCDKITAEIKNLSASRLSYKYTGP